jgi:hypothetical protein
MRWQKRLRLESLDKLQGKKITFSNMEYSLTKHYSPSSLLDSRSDELASLYLTWLHRQPLVLFNAETFAESLPGREAELILALQALCLRFPPRLLDQQYCQRLHAMAQASRQIVMNKAFDSQVDCSVLQTLCLLSLFEHAGMISQVHAVLGMAD